jgi:pimeloyl-ACP methyl ester carboxylesterase
MPSYAVLTDKTIASRTAGIDGVQLHYLTAGHGPTVILLHGYAETSHMWRPIIRLLAEKFTVIAPDLPGIGDSAIPANGLDMKTSAIRIHALARSLGVEKARVVGHDIDLMVAYAYAALFPAEVEKLVVMDAFLPGVAGWEPIYNRSTWHFRFFGPTPEALVQGRERISSNISGTISPPTKRARSRRRIAKRTPKPMRNRDVCAQGGLISLPGRNSPKSSRNSRRRS